MIISMIIINTNSVEKAKQLIKTAKIEKKPVIIKAQDENFNRKILEYGKFDILLFELKDLVKLKDSLKNINSGINHVLANIAAKDNIVFSYDLSEFQNLDKKEKAIFLSKLRQNLQICRKAKARIVLLNYRDKREARALLLSLGASSQQASEFST